MKQNIKKILLTICIILLFNGCYKIKLDGIDGTAWKSANAVTPNNEFVYIYFVDNATFKYCYVDYDLNQLNDMKESTYIRTNESSIVFSANDISLRSANFGSGNLRMLIIIPIWGGNKKTLTSAIDDGNNGNNENNWNNGNNNRNVEFVKINASHLNFEEKYLW